MNALELQGLTKHYKGFTLGPLDLTLPGGTICGLIGENGAGKSTTIRLILDMVQRDGGTVTILGRDSRTASVRAKEEIGVVLGSEGSGVSQLVKKLCDGVVRLDMAAQGTGVDSFNVSVAASCTRSRASAPQSKKQRPDRRDQNREGLGCQRMISAKS